MSLQINAICVVNVINFHRGNEFREFRVIFNADSRIGSNLGAISSGDNRHLLDAAADRSTGNFFNVSNVVQFVLHRNMEEIATLQGTCELSSIIAPLKSMAVQAALNVISVYGVPISYMAGLLGLLKVHVARLTVSFRFHGLANSVRNVAAHGCMQIASLDILQIRPRNGLGRRKCIFKYIDHISLLGNNATIFYGAPSIRDRNSR